MSSASGRRRSPSLPLVLLPAYVVLAVGFVLQVTGTVSSPWLVLAPVLLIYVVVAVAWQMRATQAGHRAFAAETDRLVATGRWVAYGRRDQPDVPRGALSFPKRDPFASTLAHGEAVPMSTRVDGREVWSFEFRRRTPGGVSETTGERSTSDESFHVVLTRLDGAGGLVDVRRAGLADRLTANDMQVGEPRFDKAFEVRSESPDTARRWLGGELAGELVRGELDHVPGGPALHDGHLRADGDVVLWWRKGPVDLSVVDDVAQLVARAAGYLRR